VTLTNEISVAAILLLVIYVFLDAIAFSPGASAPKQLARGRKTLVFLVLTIGPPRGEICLIGIPQIHFFLDS
jgi:hypothetical protein